MANSKAETERSHLMLRDRLKQVDDELTKIKTQLEKVLRERYLHIFQMTANGLLFNCVKKTCQIATFFSIGLNWTINWRQQMITMTSYEKEPMCKKKP